MRRPAIIFDFGNVIAFFDYLIAARALGRRLGVPGEELLAKARAAGFDRLAVDYESGRVTSRDFAAKVCKLVGLDITFEQFVEDWSDIFWLNDSIASLVAELKSAGYPLILGSNTNELHANFYRRKFAGTLDLFDGFVYSHEVGEMKPSRKFYLACARTAGLPPEACVFIDDLAENVRGARDAGLLAVHYEGDTEALRRELRAFGVEIGG